MLRDMVEGEIGAVATERAGIDRFVEQMLPGAVVDLDRFVVLLLHLDALEVGQALGEIVVDRRCGGRAAEDDGEDDGDLTSRQPAPTPRVHCLNVGRRVAAVRGASVGFGQCDSYAERNAPGCMIKTAEGSSRHPPHPRASYHGRKCMANEPQMARRNGVFPDSRSISGYGTAGAVFSSTRKWLSPSPCSGVCSRRYRTLRRTRPAAGRRATTLSKPG